MVKFSVGATADDAPGPDRDDGERHRPIQGVKRRIALDDGDDVGGDADGASLIVTKTSEGKAVLQVDRGRGKGFHGSARALWVNLFESSSRNGSQPHVHGPLPSLSSSHL